MPFACSICGEESTRICARCTKDACNNHLCEKCARCSDCCECEVHLSEPAAMVRPEPVARVRPATVPVVHAVEAEAAPVPGPEPDEPASSEEPPAPPAPAAGVPSGGDEGGGALPGASDMHDY